MPEDWGPPDELPPGQMIVPDPKYAIGPPPAHPVLWITDQPVPGAGQLWARLLGQHADTGLWPLLLTERTGHLSRAGLAALPPEVTRLLKHATREGRPWHAGELAPIPAGQVTMRDPATLLAQRWNQVTGQGDLDFGEDAISAVPFRSWPGLADPGEPGADPDQHAVSITTAPDGARELTGRDDPPFLGLVPADDGADAIIACGWMSPGGSLAETAAVVRSWQQRFGVRLCSLGFDTLGVSVAWSPVTLDHARRVAAEHFAFCPDLAHITGLDQYAHELIGSAVWRFRWD